MDDLEVLNSAVSMEELEYLCRESPRLSNLLDQHHAEIFTNVYKNMGWDIKRIIRHYAKKGYQKGIKYIIEGGVEREIEDYIMEESIYYNDLEVVKYLASIGVKIPDDSLIISSTQGGLEMTMYLVKMGADINSEGSEETPLELVLSNGNLEITKYLLSEGARIPMDRNGDYRLLEIATYSGNFNLVKYLIEEKGFINFQDVNNSLKTARNHNYVEIAEYLERFQDVEKTQAKKFLDRYESGNYSITDRNIHNIGIEVDKYCNDNKSDVDVLYRGLRFASRHAVRSWFHDEVLYFFEKHKKLVLNTNKITSWSKSQDTSMGFGSNVILKLENIKRNSVFCDLSRGFEHEIILRPGKYECSIISLNIGKFDTDSESEFNSNSNSNSNYDSDFDSDSD